MTEAEWLAANKPTPILNFLNENASDRKLRLFAVACSRRVEKWMRDERSRNAIEVSEQYADRIMGRRRLSAARRAAFAASKEAERSRGEGYSYTVEHSAAIVALNVSTSAEEIGSLSLGHGTAGCATTLVFHEDGDEAGWLELAYQAILLRDIFGNPFRPVAFLPRWLTSMSIGIAQAIYEERAFDRLPILADALQDAGCEDADVLAHCRGDGPHVRGCWAVDGGLGKGAVSLRRGP